MMIKKINTPKPGSSSSSGSSSRSSHSRHRSGRSSQNDTKLRQQLEEQNQKDVQHLTETKVSFDEITKGSTKKHSEDFDPDVIWEDINKDIHGGGSEHGDQEAPDVKLTSPEESSEKEQVQGDEEVKQPDQNSTSQQKDSNESEYLKQNSKNSTNINDEEKGKEEKGEEEEEEDKDEEITSQPEIVPKRVPGVSLEKMHLSIAGDDTEWQDKNYLVTTVSLFDVSISRIHDYILPKLKDYPAMEQVNLDNNNICCLEDLSLLAALNKIKILYISDNPILEQQPRLVRPFCIHVFPQLKEFNGERVGQEDRLIAAGLFAGIRKYQSLLGIGFERPKTFITEAHRNQGSYSKKYVDTILDHATTVEAKLRVLESEWDQVVENIVYRTLVNLDNPSYFAECLENV